jgi:ubiquinone/menaquinone biosynthesis C-methylase UbiE
LAFLWFLGLYYVIIPPKCNITSQVSFTRFCGKEKERTSFDSKNSIGGDALLFSIQRQFKLPKGFLGWLAGKVMEYDNRKINNWSINQLSIQNSEKILEVGYGPGYCIRRISKLYPDTLVDGVDISDTMKETAQSKNEDAIERGRVRLFVQDISQFELNEVLYDRIFSVNNYPLWRDQKQALNHLYKMLKRDGTLLITVQPRGEEESDSRARGYGEEISHALKEIGFKHVALSYKKVKPALTVSVRGVK